MIPSTTPDPLSTSNASSPVPILAPGRHAAPGKNPAPGTNPAPEKQSAPERPDAQPSINESNPSIAESSVSPSREVSWIWDIPFDRLRLKEAVNRIEGFVKRGKPSYVVTANLNYAMLHQQNEQVRVVTTDADMVLADGQPIVWRSRLGNQPLPERVAGSEMIYDLAQRARDRGWGIYFLGGKPGVAQAAADRLCEMYPNLRVAGVESPPFRQPTEEEHQQMVNRIRQSGAKILLVAFGQPKGEYWIHENYRALGVPVSIQLGASFDFIAGTAKRAPAAFQMMGMEWAYRMMTDPVRLVPRYFNNACFLAGALLRDWKKRVDRWGMGV